MIKDGYIKTDCCHFVITPLMTENDFLNSELSDSIKPLVLNEGYLSYYTNVYEVFGRNFSFRLFFVDGILESICLMPSAKVPSWNNLDREIIKMFKKENDEWLLENFGIEPPVEFAWGSIESALDNRGGGALIVIRYKRS